MCISNRLQESINQIKSHGSVKCQKALIFFIHWTSYTEKWFGKKEELKSSESLFICHLGNSFLDFLDTYCIEEENFSNGQNEKNNINVNIANGQCESQRMIFF
jgi:hypothetical protein